MPGFTPKPALAKLSLVARKDIRDNFEAHKGDLEARISELLDTPFHINFNPNAVWAYADADNTAAGDWLARYAEGFISALKDFLDKYADLGKEFFNTTVTQSELSLGVNCLGDDASSIDAEVKDGVFWILFNHKSLGANQDSLGGALLRALEAVPRDGLSLQAKFSIEDVYERRIDGVLAQIKESTGLGDVVLDPNFEENYRALVEGKKGRSADWKESFGDAHLWYFDGLREQLLDQGFKDDEMLQEGLAEALTEKTFRIRIVKELKRGSNEVVIEDGVVYLQTTVDSWYSNTSDMGRGLVELL